MWQCNDFFCHQRSWGSPPSCHDGAIQHSTYPIYKWSSRCVRASAAGLWTDRAPCWCYFMGQCEFTWCHPGQRVVQYQPRIPECFPSSILHFSQPNILLFMSLEGLWVATLHQGKISCSCMKLVCNDIGVNACYMWIWHTRSYFPRCLARENVVCDADEVLWPDPACQHDAVCIFLPVLYFLSLCMIWALRFPLFSILCIMTVKWCFSFWLTHGLIWCLAMSTVWTVLK